MCSNYLPIERIVLFFVAATPYLVFVHLIDSADAQNSCSICGFGLKVGNPDGLFSFRPGEPTVRCGLLESNGKDGLLSQGVCLLYADLAADVCDCQPQTHSPAAASSQEQCNVCGGSSKNFQISDPTGIIRTPGRWDGTKCSVFEQNVEEVDAYTCRSLLPVLIAAFCGGCRAVPTNRYPTPSPTLSSTTLRPTSAKYSIPQQRTPYPTYPNILPPATSIPSIAVSSNDPKMSFFLAMAVICVFGMVFIVLFTLFSCWKINRDGIPLRSRHSWDGIPSVSQDRNLRSLVLAALFPEQTVQKNLDGSIRSVGSTVLRYDTMTKLYKQCDADVATIESQLCSICLDQLDYEHGSTVSGLCTHIYHRDCILKWLEKDRHDDCPNCRQPMWEPETYCILEEVILWKIAEQQRRGGSSERSIFDGSSSADERGTDTGTIS